MKKLLLIVLAISLLIVSKSNGADMTQEEVQTLFEQSVSICLQAFVYGLGFGMVVKVINFFK